MKRGQYNEWLSGAYESTIIPFSQAWNLQFAASLHGKLPPEVREMEYKYLLDPETRRRPGLRALVSGEEEVDALQDEHDEKLNIPHFVRSDYVGASVAFEVVQALYRTADVADMVIRSPRHVFKALFTDRFGVGLQPFSSLRAITVHCMLDEYCTPPMRHPLTNQCRHTWEDTLHLRQAELKAHLQQLLTIQNKEGFELHIVLMQRNVRIAILAEALVTLRSICSQLVEDGAEPSLTWAYCPDDLFGESVAHDPESLQIWIHTF